MRSDILKTILYSFIGSVILLVAAFYNGYPIVYSDTSTYIVSGFTFEPPFDRPLTYGIFIWLTSLNGFSLWTVALLQGWMLSFLILLTIRDLTAYRKPYGTYLVVMGILSVFTVLPWVSGQIIADIFTSIGLLSVVHLFFNDKLKRSTRVFLYFLFFLANAMHMSHILINGVLVLLLVFLQRLRVFRSVRIDYKTVGILLVLLVLGIFSMGSSISKSRNVFFMGRMVENGILQKYLKENCPEKDFVLCECIDSIPDNTTGFLWDSDSPLYTHFTSWGDASKEFGQIIGETFKRPKYLGLHILSSIESTASQLVTFKAGDGNGAFLEGTPLYSRVNKYIPGEISVFAKSRQARGLIHPEKVKTFNLIYAFVVIISLLGLIAIYSRRRVLMPGRKALFIYIVLLSAIVINAAVNSSLVITADRFGAKLIWLIPLMFLMIIPSLGFEFSQIKWIWQNHFRWPTIKYNKGEFRNKRPLNDLNFVTLVDGLKTANLNLRRLKYFPKYSIWMFIAAVFILSMVYQYDKILLKPAQSLHLWRQSDCLSQAMNYYQDDNSFFEPSVHYLGGDRTGKAVSDFPLIYYSVGKLWKIFGHHEYIFRALVLLFFFCGLFAVFKVFEDALKDSVVALSASLFLFTSPVLVYYANNYLMDIPSFSLALIGLYFFYSYYKDGKAWQFIVFCLVLSLGGLLKIPALMGFIGIAGLFVLEWLKVRLRPEGKVFRQSKIFFLAAFASVFLIQFLWFVYVKHYNSTYNSGIFLTKILPIWEMTKEQVDLVIHHINVHIRVDYFRRETQIVYVSMLLISLVFYKRANRALLFLTLILSIGFMAFVLLFFHGLKDHDYFIINLYLLVPVVLFCFLILVRSFSSYFFHSIIFKIILIGFLIHNVTFAQNQVQNRYSHAGWENKYYVNNLHNFDRIGPYLDSIGISKVDTVISISDTSPDITLYKMNRKGWSNYGLNADSAKIEARIKMGAKYLFVSDTLSYKEPGIQSFLLNPVGSYENIDIYRLKNSE